MSDDLVEECRLAMLHENMDISRSMVHGKLVEETRIKRKNRKFKREKSYEGSTSKGRLEIQDKPRFKKWVSNKFHSNIPKANKDRVSNPKSQKARSGNSPSKKPTCSKCGNKHWGECLVLMENCFECGKSSHKVRDFPNVRSK